MNLVPVIRLNKIYSYSILTLMLIWKTSELTESRLRITARTEASQNKNNYKHFDIDIKQTTEAERDVLNSHHACIKNERSLKKNN